MFIGRNKNQDFSGKLYIDKWSTEYVENPLTGKLELIEKYEGQTEMKQVDTVSVLLLMKAGFQELLRQGQIPLSCFARAQASVTNIPILRISPSR